MAPRPAGRLGLTRAHAACPLPGDSLLAGDVRQNDRGIVIDATPDRVWPWLAQLGQDKGGFYTWTILENLAGAGITNTDRIHPEWQHPAVGDALRLSPTLMLRLAEVEPDSHLVATSEGGRGPGGSPDPGFAFTWAFCLLPHTPAAHGAPRTRLHVRERYLPTRPSVARTLPLVAVASAVMTWPMLRRIRTLATRAPVGAEDGPAS